MADRETSANDPVPPGGMVGVLGGGQLGRMLSIAAARLGLQCHIYCPEGDPSAGHVAARLTTAAYDDWTALEAFAASVDVVTYEFENIPLETAARVAAIGPLFPDARALKVSQDRLDEKTFLNGIGVPTAAFMDITVEDDIRTAMSRCGNHGFVKTRRLGYDGKGQARVSPDGPDTPTAAWAAMKGQPAIYEGRVDFDREISVIVARGRDGQTICFDPGENVHRDGILYTTTLPAAISRARMQEAVLLAGRIVNALDYVGVMGVEMFDADGPLIVNEVAPRVHNSGHWTIEACAVDQFEQHIRAICGWPLGDGSRHADALMTNLIGDEASDWTALAADPETSLHLYGKGAARPGRKMGHVTRLAPRTG